VFIPSLIGVPVRRTDLKSYDPRLVTAAGTIVGFETLLGFTTVKVQGPSMTRAFHPSILALQVPVPALERAAIIERTHERAEAARVRRAADRDGVIR
jgi:hypothetical protein